MIAGLSASGALQSLYPQYEKKKITKVKKIHSGETSAQEVASSEAKQETDSMEDTIAANYQASLAEETTDLDSLSYASQNPYVSSKKSLDSSLLIGMNVDERA